MPWHGDCWSQVMGNAIDRRLKCIKPDIITLTDLTEKTEIDALINDISTALRRAWCIFRDIDCAGSDPQIFHTLKELLKKPETLIHSFRTCDASTRNRIALNYAKGWWALESEVPHPDLLLQATKAALASLTKPKPGRPKNTPNYAMKSLAIELAMAYERHVRKPGRNVDPFSYIESGSYRDFIELVLSIIPARLRATRRGTIPNVDYLVRLGVNHINAK